MFYINYTKPETTKNELGEDSTNDISIVIHVRSKKEYEKLLEQIEAEQEELKINLISHGPVEAIDSIPKPEPFICTVCKMKEEAKAQFPSQEVKQPEDVKHVKEFQKVAKPKKEKVPKEKVPKEKVVKDKVVKEEVKKNTVKEEKAKVEKPDKPLKKEKAVKPILKKALN